MSGVKRKRNVVTLEKKLDALKRVDKGQSIKSICTDLDVGRSTLADWIKNRAQIESWCTKMASNTGLAGRSTMKPAENHKLDDALFYWFTQVREKGSPISGPILQEKAMSLNKEMGGDQNFAASLGWLDRWKKRHGVRQIGICGEKLSADSTEMEFFKGKFLDMVKKEGLTPEQVYNCDETGLNFKLIPRNTLASSSEKNAAGFKISKERTTLLVAANASGSHKLPLVMIGKAAKPRALKNLNMESFPVKYRYQKNSWMTSDIFLDWFMKEFVPAVKCFLKKKKLPQKAVLLLDNAPSHPSEDELEKDGIKAKFLPPNVTSLIQPMDQGVIENIKRRYRKRLLQFLIEGIDDGAEVIQHLKLVNMKTVGYWAASSWDEIPKESLVKAWRKLWPSVESLVFETNDSLQIVRDDSDVNNEVFSNMFKLLPGNVPDVEVEAWLSPSTDEQDLTDEEIIAAVNNTEDETDTEDEPIEKDTGISHTEATKILDEALRYIEAQDDATIADVLLFKRWRDKAAFKRTKIEQQRKITSYFVNPNAQ